MNLKSTIVFEFHKTIVLPSSTLPELIALLFSPQSERIFAFTLQGFWYGICLLEKFEQKGYLKTKFSKPKQKQEFVFWVEKKKNGYGNHVHTSFYFFIQVTFPVARVPWFSIFRCKYLFLTLASISFGKHRDIFGFKISDLSFKGLTERCSGRGNEYEKWWWWLFIRLLAGPHWCLGAWLSLHLPH